MATVQGILNWRADRDSYGYRTYVVTYLVNAAVTESPVAVMTASGLPTIGNLFSLEGYTGSDTWCWCRPELSMRIHDGIPGDPAEWYEVDITFSNQPLRRCNEFTIQNPLLEPQKISGSYLRTQWETLFDKNNYRVVTSVNEPIQGPKVTFDYVKPTVRIEQNIAALGLYTFSGMVNTVNEEPMWGCPERTVKLTNVTWDRKIWGVCTFYYTRIFDFEVDIYAHDRYNTLIGHDREVFDSGSLCLNGGWITDLADPNKGAWKLRTDVTYTTQDSLLTLGPGDIIAYKDLNHELNRVFLDGHGRPANTKIVTSAGAVLTGTGYTAAPYTDASGKTGPPASTTLQFYRESNFFILGIPTTL